jgi:hypothetical protein
MTCRVARSFDNQRRMEPVYCSECGSIHPEARGALNTLGPHLCPICAQSIVGHGVAERRARFPEKDPAEACGAVQCDELQPATST